MKAYKCDECKEYLDDLPYGDMELKRKVIKRVVVGYTVFRYDLCEKCYKKIKEEREK